MSNSANIFKINQDKTVKGIFCYSNGDINGVGKMLQEHYQDADKVDELIELGEIVSLGASPKMSPDFADKGTDAFNSIYGIANVPEFDENQYTVAYHRDRGDSKDIIQYDDFFLHTLFAKRAQGKRLDFVYDKGQWFVTNYTVDFKLIPLSEAISNGQFKEIA